MPGRGRSAEGLSGIGLGHVASGWAFRSAREAAAACARLFEKPAQRNLSQAALETLAIVLGEPFAQVFKPILATVIDALNGFLKFVRAMPAGLKKGLAALFVGAGATPTVVGAALAAKAAIALLTIAPAAAGGP